MAASVKKEPNSDLYESEDRNSQGTYSFAADSNNRAGFDRARWSGHDLELLFRWFDVPDNHRRYNHGVKVKAVRALAETIPGKTDRQVQNKMTALENLYHQCKTKLKQGIPLTERDVESGITTAPAKVKSIFRYYYEMDHILNGQATNNSRNNDDNEYDSPPRNNGPRHSGAENSTSSYFTSQGNTDRGREHYNSRNDYNGDKSYRYSNNGSSQRHYQSEGPREHHPSNNALQDDNSPHSSQSLQHHTSDRTSRHPADSNTASHPSRNPDPSNGTPVINHSAEHYNYGDKPGYTHNSDVRIVHSSSRSFSRKERLLRLQEDKLALKRKRHSESMEFANRHLEAEEKWRRQLHEDIQEDLILRRQELQLRQDELKLLRVRLNQGEIKLDSEEQKINTNSQPIEPPMNYPASQDSITLENPSGTHES